MTRFGIKLRLGTKLHVLEGNTIRNAAQGGIGLIQSNVGQVKISRNIVTDTPGWAIDLYGVSGPDPNDPGDADAGANTLLNTPEITSATSTLVTGTGLAGATVEVFRATRLTGQFGLPDQYLGSATVTSAGIWNAAVSTTAGNRVTALQIRSGRDTSELSANTLVTLAGPNNAPTAGFTPNCTGLSCTFTDSSTDSDGTIISRSWTFGDGGTSTATNPTHPYATGGTYTVVLTVTDDDGGTDTETQQVTVATANVLPTAAFTASCNELACDFTDTSTDSDGTIASRAWTFGDGGTSTATNPSHTYAAAGTFTVGLTVTDNRGGSASTSKSVVVAQANVLARDTYSRTVSSGWGSADVGGAWTVSGTAANWAVSSGTGRMTLPAAGATRSAALAGVSVVDVDLLVSVTADSAASGSGLYVYTEARYSDTANQYRAKVRIAADGSVYLGASRVAAGTQAAIGSEVVVPGLTYTPGTPIWVRAQFTGTSPTTIRVRAWSGATEPTGWTYTGTDSTAALQAAGAVGVRGFLAANANPAPVTLSWDELTVKQLP